MCISVEREIGQILVYERELGLGSRGLTGGVDSSSPAVPTMSCTSSLYLPTSLLHPHVKINQKAILYMVELHQGSECSCIIASVCSF